MSFNGKDLGCDRDDNGSLTATVEYSEPKVELPSLASQKWYSTDSLPEVQSSYNDAAWMSADMAKTCNSHRDLTTPTSLYGSDYGFNTGSLLFRGHFTAAGNESSLSLQTQGGSAFGSSVWLDNTFIGSFVGFDAATIGNSTFKLPNLSAGSDHVLTVLIDHMGLDEDWVVGSETMKNPRGILNYDLSGRPQSAITWKIAGNLGGEDFLDKIRGPLNEGAMYAERQGYHLPNPPVTNPDWKQSGGPTEGIASAGVAWYVTNFDLNMPEGYDIPLSIQFTNSSTTPASTAEYGTGSTAPAYRVQLYVNGWQFGKYVHNIGPQTKFPVPEGIWNYHGTNWVAISLWALEKDGAKVEGVELVAGHPVLTGREKVQVVDSPAWSQRQGAY
jgi:hypothetical protein